MGVSGDDNKNSYSKTILQFAVTSGFGHLIDIRGSDYNTAGVLTSSTIAMGATSFGVTSATGIEVGDYIDIRDTRYGHWSNGPASNMVGQVVKVTGKSGNTLTIEDKITIGHSSSYPTKAHRFEPIRAAGVVNVILRRGTSCIKDRGNAVNIEQAVNCFVTGVSSFYSGFSHVQLRQSSHITVRGNYFALGWDYGGGGHGYGIDIRDRTTNVLITDNVLRNLRHHIILGASACRNVISYNYTEGQTWYVDEDDESGGFINNLAESYHHHMGEISFHGNFPHRNLIEGNNTNNIFMDGYFESRFPQSSSQYTQNGPYNVIFRNKVRTYTVGVFAADHTILIGNDLPTNLPLLYESPSGILAWIGGLDGFAGSDYVFDTYGLFVDTDNSIKYPPHIAWALYGYLMANYLVMRDISYYLPSYTQLPLLQLEIRFLLELLLEYGIHQFSLWQDLIF